MVVLCFNGGTLRRCGASSSEDSCVRNGAASSSLESDSIAPAPPLRWLLVKSRSRDGSFGFWSLSLSELSLELSSRRGGMVVVSWPAAAAGCWPVLASCWLLAAFGAKCVFGVQRGGGRTSRRVRVAAPPSGAY